MNVECLSFKNRKVIDIDTLLFNLQNAGPYSKSIFERCSFMMDERMKESLKYSENM